MKRFVLSPEALLDLRDIDSYLMELPEVPAQRIAARLESALQNMAEHPYLGSHQSDLTRLISQ